MNVIVVKLSMIFIYLYKEKKKSPSILYVCMARYVIVPIDNFQTDQTACISMKHKLSQDRY